MLAFRSEGDVTAWLERTGHGFGVMIDFATMWSIAQPWYSGRLEAGWRGLSAEAGQAIFDELGLTGAWWRLIEP